jgi:hypothetical protein
MVWAHPICQGCAYRRCLGSLPRLDGITFTSHWFPLDDGSRAVSLSRSSRLDGRSFNRAQHLAEHRAGRRIVVEAQGNIAR